MRPFTLAPALRLLALLFVLGPVLGASRSAEAGLTVEVQSVARGNVLVGRPSGDTGSFAPGTGICLYRGNRGVACGHVVELGSSIRVQLTHGTNRFSAGERLKTSLAQKFSKAGPPTETAPREPSSPPSYSGSSPTPRFLLGGGTAVNFASSSYVNLLLDGQYGTGHFVVGLKLIVIPYSELLGIGGFLGAYYYLSPGFREFFFGIGAGLINLDGKTATQTEAIFVPAGQLTIGYRLPLGHRFNIAADAGFTYLSKTKGERIDYNLNTFIPMFEIEGALTF